MSRQKDEREIRALRAQLAEARRHVEALVAQQDRPSAYSNEDVRRAFAAARAWLKGGG